MSQPRDYPLLLVGQTWECKPYMTPRAHYRRAIVERDERMVSYVDAYGCQRTCTLEAFEAWRIDRQAWLVEGVLPPVEIEAVIERAPEPLWPSLISLAEAARIHGVHKNTLRYHAIQGHIEALSPVRGEHRWLLDEESLEAFLATWEKDH